MAGLILYPGDAIFVKGKGKIPWFIRFFTKEAGEKAKTKYNHGEMVTVGGPPEEAQIIEAVGNGVQEIGFVEKHGSGPWPNLAIYRRRDVAGKELVRLVADVRKELGEGYDYGSLLLIFGDWLVGQTIRRRVTFLARLGGVSPMVFCTELMARTYRKIGETFGRPSASSTYPDDMGDWMEEHNEEWACVLAFGEGDVK